MSPPVAIAFVLSASSSSRSPPRGSRSRRRAWRWKRSRRRAHRRDRISAWDAHSACACRPASSRRGKKYEFPRYPTAEIDEENNKVTLKQKKSHG